MIGGLVQQQDARPLRQRAGDVRPLPLAARQRSPTAPGECGQFHPCQRGVDHSTIGTAQGLPAAAERGAAEGHHVGDA
jgi:hypothetical protein